jgi:Holin of 3TMs, for gene-transfer release
MDPISIALGLAQFVPGVIRWISGDDSKAAAVADQVIGVAKTVTGKDSGQDALAAIQADPALALQLQQSWMAHEVAILQEETKQLGEINATMRAEAASGDAYVRRWRPTFGYAVALTWTATMGAVSWAIVTQPMQAPAIIAALVNTSPIWGIALAVLGVAVVKRSHDKAGSAGSEQPGGLLGRLVGGAGK